MVNISKLAVYDSTGVLRLNSLNASQVAIVTHDYRHIDTDPMSGFIHTRAGPYCEIICHPDSVPTADVFNKFTAICDKFMPGQQFLVARPNRLAFGLFLIFRRPLLRTAPDGHQIYGEFNMNSMYMITETDTLARAQEVINDTDRMQLISKWITSLGRVPQ